MTRAEIEAASEETVRAVATAICESAGADLNALDADEQAAFEDGARAAIGACWACWKAQGLIIELTKEQFVRASKNRLEA